MKSEGSSRRYRWILVGGCAAAAVLVAGLAVVGAPQPDRRTTTVSPSAGNSEASSPAPEGSAVEETAPAPTGAAGLGEPYRFGPESASRTLAIWEDMECPACAAFEYDAYVALTDALGLGELQIEYFIAPTDREGSVTSALALGCAADQDRFKDFHSALFANQRPDAEEGFTISELYELATVAGVKDVDAFSVCLESARYAEYVQSIVDKGVEIGLAGTPTLILDGNVVDLPSVGWDGFIESLGLDPKDYPYE